MPHSRRFSAATLVTLYLSGLLALLFHLATEEHLMAVQRGLANASHPSLNAVCPCRRGHVPHGADDHEANLTTDDPGADGLASALAALDTTGRPLDASEAPLLEALEPDLEPALAKIPIAERSRPPDSLCCRDTRQTRAPPAAGQALRGGIFVA